MAVARNDKTDMKHPIRQLEKCWNEARRKKDPVADCLYLATVDAASAPHVRTVLIKSIGENGIGFVTNATGPKAAQMKINSQVEACIHWPKLQIQIRVRGSVVAMPSETVEALWKIRPREAQILYGLGIPQSSPIPSYGYLMKQVLKKAKEWGSLKTPPRAPNYIGFLIVPERIEFLYYHSNRLSERHAFEKTPKGWQKIILAP